MTIRQIRIPSTDPRLGRHVYHDSRSLAYPFRASGAPVRTVQHHRYAPVFDQGQLGSCTGNAALGCLGTGPFYTSFEPSIPLEVFNEEHAVAIYGEATEADSYPGQYPPDDTGSDGLSVAKVLKTHGWISGYQHVLNGADGVAQALQTTPLIVGVPWFNSMYEPNSNGIIPVDQSSGVAGGHEFVIDGFNVEDNLFHMANSWGTGWGNAGCGFITRTGLDTLLKADGDATVFTPTTQPAPVPVTDSALARLLAKESHWLGSHFPAVGSTKAQAEVRRYLTAIGAL